MKRRQGLGSVTMVDGRLWVRGARQPDGSRPSLGYVHTQEEADALLLNAAQAIRVRAKEGARTFIEFAEKELDAREAFTKNSTIRTDRNRFKTHLRSASWAKKPIEKITTVDGAAWLREMQTKPAQDRRGKRKVSRATIQRALSLASALFDAAGPQGAGLIPRNPFAELEALPDKGQTKETWTFLVLKEQEAIRDYTPKPEHAHPVQEDEQLMILFAAGSGPRLGEQVNLLLTDLHVGEDEEKPHAIVRFGSPNESRKNGEILRLEIFGMALWAIRRWLEIRTAFLTAENGHVYTSPLVFPTKRGCRRRKPLGNGHFRPCAAGTHKMKSGKPYRVKKGEGTHVYVDRLKEVFVMCGITRNVRWHDMRHTCATSLVSGIWGDAFSLRETQGQLGQTSMQSTDRYAHFADDARDRARAKVRDYVVPTPLKVGYGLVGGGSTTPSQNAAIRNDIEEVGPVGLEPTTYGLKEPGIVELLRGLADKKAPDNQLVTNLASTLVAILEKEGSGS